MRKFSIYFAIIFLAVVLQMSVVPIVFGYSWVPDIVLSMVVAWALIDGFEGFIPWAVFSGIFYDIFSYSTVGISAIVFVVVAYGVGFFSKRFSMEMRGVGVLLSIFFIFSSTVGAKIIMAFSWVQGMAKAESGGGLFSLGGSFLAAFFWNLVFFFGWFFILNKIEEVFYFKSKDKIIV